MLVPPIATNRASHATTLCRTALTAREIMFAWLLVMCGRLTRRRNRWTGPACNSPSPLSILSVAQHERLQPRHGMATGRCEHALGGQLDALAVLEQLAPCVGQTQQHRFLGPGSERHGAIGHENRLGLALRGGDVSALWHLIPEQVE